jgi:hypothetical protein
MSFWSPRARISPAPPRTPTRPSPIPAGAGGYADWIRFNINGFRTVADAVAFAQTRVGFEMRAVPPLSHSMVPGHQAQMKASYPEFAAELVAICEPELSDITHRKPSSPSTARGT